MRHILLSATLIFAATTALAQQAGPTATAPGQMNHMAHMNMNNAPVSEPGQGAFAAIAEIVQTLEADPETDWSKVNIAALREHLRDMNLVMIDARVAAADSKGGQTFTVTGSSDVVPSIRRMTHAHAAVMDGVDGWHFSVSDIENGVVFTATAPERDKAKLEGLGFFGIMASGMHHQAHHWMIATGMNPHQ